MPGAGVSGGKKKSGGKKTATVADRLPNVDESKEDEGADADDESVDGAAKGADDEDAASEPQDSEFEEDEADDDNDYNAENYFSGGEGDEGSVEGGGDADEGY